MMLELKVKTKPPIGEIDPKATRGFRNASLAKCTHFLEILILVPQNQ